MVLSLLVPLPGGFPGFRRAGIAPKARERDNAFLSPEKAVWYAFPCNYHPPRRADRPK